MFTRRKFIAALVAAPVAAYGAMRWGQAGQYWWLPADTRRWIEGAGQSPHVFYGDRQWVSLTSYVSQRLVTSDVDYWRLSCIAHGGHDPLTPPFRRSRARDKAVQAQILAAAAPS